MNLRDSIQKLLQWGIKTGHYFKKESIVKTIKTSEFGKGGELSTMVGKGTAIEGDIHVQNSLRIDGKVTGNIQATDSVVVGRDGEVQGNIKAKNVLLAGKVIGNVKSQDKVFLESKAVILGDIQAARLVVDEGASFEGKCSMKNGVAKTQPSVKPEGD